MSRVSSAALRESQQLTCHGLPRLIARRYQVEHLIGRGADALVFKVHDRTTGTEVALKRLLSLEDADRARRRRLSFRREFHTLTTLDHPHIVKVHDFGVDGAELFYTMELLDGAQLDSGGRWAPSRVCQLLHDLGSVLVFLHGRKLIHGDISLRNIGWASDGVVKLLDFGTLATVGALGRGRGTLPYMSPEIQRGLPLDHRADLFSLGALAFRLLTGHGPFVADERSDFERVWRTRPTAPIQLNPVVSQELNDLVVSMISVDPLGRPSSAAEVIDRVRGMGGVSRVSEHETMRGYLASTSLVGREGEMRWLRHAVRRAHRGRGGAVMIEAPSGLGKSRLLKELGVEAQLSGARLLVAGGDAVDRGPYRVLATLIRDLLPAATHTARDGLTLVRPIDGPLQALRGWAGLGPQHSAAHERDPGQARLDLQRRLTARILAEADRRPLVLLIDDLQRCDEASAAVLAALAFQAHLHRVLLVSTLRSDEPVLAPGAVASVRGQSKVMQLAGLGEPQVRALVQAIFGDMDHLERVAGWIHGASGGSPLQCTELARQLVEQGTIRYEDGLWKIPPELGSEQLPRELVDAMEARIRTLAPVARHLGEALAVHGGDLSLELCVALVDSGGEAAAFAALDELVQNEVLVGAGERLRFRHDGLREALLRGLDDRRRQELHHQVGLLLEQGRSGPDREEEVGWHLLRGREERRGARLLARAGRRHIAQRSFADAVAPLEAALQVFERLGGQPRRCCELRQDLVRAGVIANREAALRHGERVIEALQRYAGIRWMERLGRWTGRLLALLLVLLSSSLIWPLRRRSRRGPPPLQALVSLFSMVNYLAAVKALSLDFEGVRALPRLLEPVALISRRSLAHGSYQLCRSYELVLTGHWRQVRDNVSTYLELARCTRIRLEHPMDNELGEGACRYMLAIIAACELSPSCLEQFDRLESMNLHFFEVSAKLGRVLYHRQRGEEDRARELEAEAQLLFVQIGSMWLWESQLKWFSALCFCATRDLPALKRSTHQLEQLRAAGVAVDPFLDLCRGTYVLERGQPQQARRIFSAVLGGAECQTNPLLRQATLNVLGQALLACGEVDQALAAAREGVSLGSDPRTSVIPLYVYNACNLALAESASGNHAGAALRLERMLRAVDDNPLICGTLHEKRTIVALVAGDRAATAQHLELTDRWFRSSGNPALVARCEKIAAQVAAHGARLTHTGPAPCSGIIAERISGRRTAVWKVA